jgi:aryl-alcohol dehydrogenase-like predicted oxidoreductase
MLRVTLEQTVRDLGRAPDIVFLHNPEATLTGRADADTLWARACHTLSDAAAAGLCNAWGVATWNPLPLLRVADAACPPEALMVRAGLLVSHRTLTAVEALASRWRLPRQRVWGMSPFGGNPADPIWSTVDPRMLLQDNTARLSALQAAFRVAYELPKVGAVAVGAENPCHLAELLEAVPHPVDERMIRAYRALLDGHQPHTVVRPAMSPEASARAGAPRGSCG